MKAGGTKLALLHSDGFEDRPIGSIGDRYQAHQYNVSAGSGITASGRTGKGLLLSTGILDVYDHITWQSDTTHSSLYVGIAHVQGYPVGALISIRYSGIPQIYAQLNANRTISVIRYDAGANTVLATSSQTVPSTPASTFFYVELYGKIHTTTGAYELRIDGTRWLSASGLNTSSTGDNFANQSRVINNSAIADGSTTTVDDMYISDDDAADGAATIVGFAGPVHVKWLENTANGDTVEWTPHGGNNYQNVGETTGKDDDTTYNGGVDDGDVDLFQLANLEVPLVTIKALAVFQWARKEDALYRGVTPIARVSGTNYSGTEEELGASYERVFHAFERNPATNDEWTLAGVNEAQIGQMVNH